jgi:MFS family permease
MTDTDRKQHKIFYGWWIVSASFFILGYFGGIFFYGFTAILDPVAVEFGWSYARISVAASIRGMESGILAPLVGWLIDKWGPRKLLMSGITIAALGTFLLSQANSLAVFYGSFVVISIGLSACTNIVPMAVVGNWFRRKMSMVTGIVVSGTAFGGFMIPLVTKIIDTFGWRMAMIYLGAAALVIFLPLALVIRHKPEQYGYLPDGDTATTQIVQKDISAVQVIDVDIDVKHALKSRIFWFIATATVCSFLIANSVVTHVMTYLSTVGIERSLASFVASGIPIMTIVSRLGFGWLGDKFDKRRVMASGYTLMFFGLVLFSTVTITRTWMLIPFIIIFGLGYGGPIPVMPAILREYFGRSQLGTLIGFVMGIAMVGGIISPPITGWIFDTFGSYQIAWFMCAGFAIIGAVSMISIPPVRNVIETASSKGS